MADQHFFRLRRRSWPRCATCSAATHAALKEEVGPASLATPSDFDPTNYHFVKGENLEFFPYQYLDFPKHFHDSNTFAFRTLFWWGHHLVCALMLEGRGSSSTRHGSWTGFISSPGRGWNFRWRRRCGNGNAARGIRCRSPTIARRRLPPWWPNGPFEDRPFPAVHRSADSVGSDAGIQPRDLSGHPTDRHPIAACG